MSLISKKDIDEDVSLFSRSNQTSIKVVVVGDCAVGKTSMLITHCNGFFPEDFIPTVFDNYSTQIVYDDIIFSITPWDTSGQSDYDRLRPLSYPETNIFIICASLVGRNSFENVKTKWFPELCHHCGDDDNCDVPIILVGTKLDLRDDPRTINELRERDETPITKEEGEKIASEIRAFNYIETSSKTQKNLKYVFENVVQAYLNPNDSRISIKKKKLFLLNWIDKINKKIKEKQIEKAKLKLQEEERKKKEEEERKLKEEEEKIKKKLREIEKIENNFKTTKTDEKLIKKKMEEIKILEEENFKFCQICFDNEKNCVIIPCGHTLCMTCAETLREGKNICCFCKRKIEKLQKVIL